MGRLGGVLTTEAFPDGPDGKVKAHRATHIEYPPGTRFDVAAAANCQASEADFQQKGLGACPADSKVGEGTAEVETTGNAPKSEPFTFDITVFNTSHPKDDPSLEGVMLVFHSGDQVTNVILSKIEGNVQTEETEPTCVPPGQPPQCPFGEFAPKRVRVDAPPNSRTVDGVIHNGATTPPTCPAIGHWTIRHGHTYSDGTTDTFVNELPCKATPPRPLRVTVKPGTVRAGRSTKFTVTAISDRTPVPGARVRVGRSLVRTGSDGRASATLRVHRPGTHTVRASAAGYQRASATYRATR